MANTIILGIVGLQEVLIIGFFLVFLFGGSKIPQLMKGIGQGINEFKKTQKSIES